MTAQLQIFCFFVSLLVISVVGRPQVWNIGFMPNPGSTTAVTQAPTTASLPVVDASGSTTAAPVRATTPSPAYYDCLSRCPTTSEYNPICGSDSLNYHNLGRLQCAARCGTAVTMVRAGTCLSLG